MNHLQYSNLLRKTGGIGIGINVSEKRFIRFIADQFVK